MPGFKIEIRSDQAKQDGNAPLRLRIRHKGVRRFMSLGISINTRHWNDNASRVRKSYKNHEQVNSFLADVESACEGCVHELVSGGIQVTADRLFHCIGRAIGSQAGGDDFVKYAREFVEGYRREGKASSYQRFTVILNKLEAYRRGLAFDDLTPEFLRRFMTHLRQHYRNNTNTISKNIAGIRTIMYAAIREGRYPQERNPFFNIRLKTEPVKKNHLRPWEIDAIEALELTPGEGPFKARDFFMFSFYMFGLRFSDVCLIEPKHIRGERLEWKMDKTGRDHGVLITPPARAILDRYADRVGERFIFPLLDGYDISDPLRLRKVINSRNSRVNQDLKKVIDRAGVESKVSFHIARHSIAGYLLRKGWGIHDISKALGHSSIKQTEAYFKGFDFHDLDDKMRDLWR